MEDQMHFASRLIAAAFVVSALAVFSNSARAQDDNFMTNLLNNCSQEIRTYCAQIASGTGRLSACFAAHEDELSERCGGALHEVAPRLGAMANSIAFIETSCKKEIETYCASVELGEGRFTRCLKARYDDATPICQQALLGIGIRQ